MKNIKIGIIGLGYVGLPLAFEFAKKYKVIGFDINKTRVSELLSGIDNTLEVSKSNLKSVLFSTNNQLIGLKPTDKSDELNTCNFYIITVPTPIDKNKNPDLTPLIKASEIVGKQLQNDNYVVFESTVYPGATEEICIPILEKSSGLKLNKDFFVGYSPERINPGDKEHTVTKIKKVVSGSNAESSIFINEIYNNIIEAGTYIAESIKVAECAKVIENTQRDINIAFVNELSKICSKLDISVHEVLDAASTKWNFLNFKPGLVGGHCIGVDPYYLAQKAQQINYFPEIILAGRRINESMGEHFADLIIDNLIQKNCLNNNTEILIMGFTFKENCPDIRNTGVINILNKLLEKGIKTDIYDPWASKNDVKKHYNIDVIENLYSKKYDAIIVAVAHNEFINFEYENLKKNKYSPILDIKNIVENKSKIKI